MVCRFGTSCMRVLQVCVLIGQNRPSSVSGGPQSGERLLTRRGLARSICATVKREALSIIAFDLGQAVLLMYRDSRPIWVVKETVVEQP